MAEVKKEAWSAKLSPETLDQLRGIVKEWPDSEAAVVALMSAYEQQREQAERPEHYKLVKQAESLAAALVSLVARTDDDKEQGIEAVRQEYEGENGKLTAEQKMNAMLQNQYCEALAARAAAEAERDAAIADRDKAIAERDAAIMARDAAEAHAQDIDDMRQMLTSLTSLSESK